jgi:hypothetical protein
MPLGTRAARHNDHDEREGRRPYCRMTTLSGTRRCLRTGVRATYRVVTLSQSTWREAEDGFLSPSGAASGSVGSRPCGAATLYGLALAVALAQLVASWAWSAGAHVNVEQVALHEEAVAHRHADHHGGQHAHSHGHHHASPEAPGPVYAPADHTNPYQDVLHGALVRRPDLLSRGDGHRRDALEFFSAAQNFPPVPHRPPITP